MPRLRNALLAALAVLCVPALFALDIPQNPTAARTAVPGTINYIEGSAAIDGQPLTANAVGSATLQAGQKISTAQGRAEILLTPGIFFRLGDNSTAKMVAPDLTNTVVSLEHGRAAVEVDQIFKANDIHVVEDNVPVQLVKPGLYEFDADRGSVMVFNGEAAALKPNGKFVAIKSGHILKVGAAAAMKTAKFDENEQEQTGLYRWSSLRSDYLAEANEQIAGDYAGAAYSPGWYWDPYMWDYTFVGPYPFYSPFGWGFYPLGWGGWGGWGGYYGGFYGHGHDHRLGAGRSGFDRGFRAGGSMGGFHGGIGSGGGFHGGGGRGR